VWVTKLAAYAQAPVVASELDWWRAALAPASSAILPVDGEGDRALGASRVLTFRLDRSATQRLREDGLRAYGLRPDEMLLTALAQTLAAWSGHAGALIDLEGHGREDVIDDVDLSRTVGWFTTRYPVWLDAPTDAGAALVAVKEQLRAVPHKGLHFGLLTHLRDDTAVAATIRGLPKAGVSFNYLGQFDRTLDSDGRFGLAQESGGISASDTSPMAHLLDLNGRIVDGALSLTWRYSPGVLADATVRGLVDDFAARVDALTRHCSATERLANRQSVSALAAHLKVSARELPGNILPLNALGSRINLFCLHPGYGLISEFQPLATALDGTATVYGVQSPIYSEPSWRAASFDAMAADYVDRICRIAPRGPICLLGWSLGGRLAVSMARHVAIRQRELAFVGLVDIGAELDRVEVTPAEMARLNAELPVLFASLRDVFRGEVSQIMSGQDQAISRTPHSPRTAIANDDDRLIETMVDVVAHHRRLLLDHQYPRIATMLHLWWAAHPARPPEPTEWRDYTSAGVEVVDTLDATHATIIRHPALAARIRDILSQRCAVRSGA